MYKNGIKLHKMQDNFLTGETKKSEAGVTQIPDTAYSFVVQCTTLTGVVWIVCTAGPRDVLVLVVLVVGAR